MFTRPPPKKCGFTLIKLIVVIAILAIITAVAVPTAFGSIENVRKAACKSNEDNILSAWRLENADVSTYFKTERQLYWWSYPIVDNAGNLLYTITYANHAGAIGSTQQSGYLVSVNGKLYAVGKTGSRVDVGYSGNQSKMQTPEMLVAYLKSNGYVEVESPEG